MNRLERVQRLGLSSGADAFDIIVRQLPGIRRNLDLSPQVDTLIQLQNELNTIQLNIQRLQPLINSDIYSQAHQEISDLINRVTSEVDIMTSDINTNVTNEVVIEMETEAPNQTIEPIITQETGRVKINREKLENLLDLGFSVRRIAKDGLLGRKMHYNTIHSLMSKEKMQPIRKRYTTKSDAELKVLIGEISKEYPNSGIREMVAHLKRQDPPVKLQRERCRSLMAEVDPVGLAMRWAQVIKRRQYKVPSPNSLWHIDSNHSLVRWGLVVFGQIDGYSRLISQLHLSTDNTAATALFTFIESIKEYAVPSRARMDGGSEFNHVEYMLKELNGPNRGSFIRGPSVHNQRIERLWRDVFTKVLEKFYKLFYHMEDHAILDILNPMHMFSLQFVFAPRIQNALKEWQMAHNHHPVRTEGNQTPLQLWYGASLQMQNTNSTAINNLFRRDLGEVDLSVDEILNSFGLVEPEDISVVLPRYIAPLTPQQLSNLKDEINPLGQSDHDGVDIYGRVVQFITRCRES